MNLKFWLELFKEYEKTYPNPEKVEVEFNMKGLHLRCTQRLETVEEITLFLKEVED